MMGKRNFIRGVAAALMTGAGGSLATSLLLKENVLGAGIEDRADIRQRELLVDDMVASIRQSINSADTREALQGNGDRLLSRVLRSMQMPIDPQFIKGTKYDASDERNKYALQFAYPRDAQNKRTVSLIPASAGESRFVKPGIAYANGFYFGRRDKVVTARHAYNTARGAPATVDVRDIGIATVPESLWAKAENVVPDDTSMTNQDIHVAYVTVESVDPDATSDHGCKSYPGVAVRIQREWIDKVFLTTPPALKERLAKSFMIQLPADEAAGATASDKPATGVSGAPVFTIGDGRKVLAGIFHMVVAIPEPETGRTFDIGFFHGIEEIREQYSEHMKG